ncbi:MAG TPA: hypothetical protein VGZ22_18525 [Isosphaeraceae bacterium]|jgi:hypothetical protein|nr:hypothetical protein [Isosphaeraceae bacterium]
MISEKRLLANRLNAQKSTGPRTPDGKARSRRNALKHGLMGDGTVLPIEDEALFKERMHGWTCTKRPRGEVEQYLLASAVVATVRLDRCARNEFADIAKRRRTAIGSWERLQTLQLKKVTVKLARRPAAVVARLESFARGCDWLVDEWDVLEQALTGPGFWTLEEGEHAQRLLARDPHEDVPAEDPLAELRRAIDTLRSADKSSEHINNTNQTAVVDDARAELLGVVRAEIERLGTIRPRVWERQDGPALAERINLATFDNSADGKLRRRYESASNVDLHRALNQFSKARKDLEHEKRQPDYVPPGYEGAGSSQLPALVPTHSVPEPPPPPWKFLPPREEPVAQPTVVEAAAKNPDSVQKEVPGHRGQATGVEMRMEPTETGVTPERPTTSAHHAKANTSGSERRPLPAPGWSQASGSHPPT